MVLSTFIRSIFLGIFSTSSLSYSHGTSNYDYFSSRNKKRGPFYRVIQKARHRHCRIYSFYLSSYSFLFVLAYLLSFLQKNKYLKYSIVPLLIIGYVYLNAQNYYFFYQKPNNQMRDAEKIAESIIPHISSKKIQLVPLPIWVTDGH